MKELPKQKTVIREAALCFVSLCQCSNKGLQGISQKDLWTNQLNELIDTCQKLIDLVYSCVDVVSVSTNDLILLELQLYYDLHCRAIYSNSVFIKFIGLHSYLPTSLEEK